MDLDAFTEHPSIPIGVAALAIIYWLACWLSGRRPTSRQVAWFILALATIFYAQTVLDEYADHRIFCMHMLQHLMQAFVIPPLLLLGTPDWMLRPWVLSRYVEPVARFFTNPLVAFLVFTAVFVTAHLPPVFDKMCRDEDFHIFVHLCFMVSGVLLWWPILSPLAEMPRLSYPHQTLYLFLLMIPMTAVAAPITLAEHVSYPWYLEGPHGWGLKPMEDQIFGGLLMWIGQATYVMCIWSAIFYRWSRSEDQEDPIVFTTPPRPQVTPLHARTHQA